jgi:chemotaxis protein methyltransferase CheR
VRVLRLADVDLDQYKRQQLDRRLAMLLRRLRLPDLDAYGERLADDPSEVVRFQGWITINVTEFFRDPERWEHLRQRLLPSLLKERGRLRIWSAGCSDGAEPYSVAMLLAELGRTDDYLLGTDVDASILRRAAAGGPYDEATIANVSPERRRRFLLRQGRGCSVGSELRGRVALGQADLTRRPPEGEFDLILCRNVVIYFTEAAKAAALTGLSGALRPGGILFSGLTEVLPHANPYGLAYHGASFYRRGL